MAILIHVPGDTTRSTVRFATLCDAVRISRALSVPTRTYETRVVVRADMARLNSLCQPIQVAAQENLVVVPSTSDSVAQRSEEPEDQPYYEHNRPDCPHDGDPRDESNDEKYNAENNHEASVTTR
jgi:hypothetical protein